MLTPHVDENQGPLEACLIVGLGNPGREYQNNRHNIGFMVINEIAHQMNVRMMRVQSKAIIGTGLFNGIKITLAKPQTYMNLSGESVGPLMRFYKVPLSRLLVIHDDLDLPFGTLRLRPGGGSGGQKGVASIIQKLGTQDFPRMRLGVGRPPGQMDAAAYVLQDIPKGDEELLKMILGQSVQAVEAFITKSLENAMNQFNGSLDK